MLSVFISFIINPDQLLTGSVTDNYDGEINKYFIDHKNKMNNLIQHVTMNLNTIQIKEIMESMFLILSYNGQWIKK